MGSSQLLETLIGRPDENIAKSWRTHFDELLPEVVAFDRAGELMRALHDRAVTVGLATSSPQDLLEAFQDKIGATEAVDVVVTASDVEEAKPEPDVFEVALAKADLARERAIVVGDSVWDAQAAAHARLACLALETGGFSGAELKRDGVIAVYEDAGDLLDHLDDSPLAALRS